MGKRVEVGGREVAIEGFRAFKAVRAGSIVSKITKAVPELQTEMAAFIRKYEQANVIELDRASAAFRYPRNVAGMTEEDWASCNNRIKLHESPSTNEVIAAVFPTVFEQAEEHVFELLAIVAAPNAELRAADEKSDEAVDEYLGAQKAWLKYDAELSELLELLVAALEVVGEQFQDKLERLGKAMALFGLQVRQRVDELEEAETEPEPESPTTTTSTEPTLPSGKPDSSTDSPPHITGLEDTSSTESRGELLSGSAHS